MSKTQKRTNSYIQRPSMITLTDFMRIQHEIIPSNAEYENRKEKDQQLKQLSQTKARNWPDSIEMKKKTQFDSHKKKFLEEEEMRRKIDEEERKFQQIQNNLVIDRAKNLLFNQQDVVKSFNNTMMYSDMLKERDFQKEIKQRKEEINRTIEQQFFDLDQKKMEEYDRNEAIKKQIELDKRKERMKIINEQLQESKIKRIQDYQEKIVEGHLMKLKMQKNLEEDKKKEAERELFRQKQREEFILANEKLEKIKEEKRLKDLAEDKKIEEFAFKKAQLDSLREKVAKDKFNEKQAQRAKMIEKQINYLNSIKKKEDEILQKNLKEAEEKKKAEEAKKKARYDKMAKEIEEQRDFIKRKKEEQIIQNKKDEAAFVDDWKKKMKQLEKDEQIEKQMIKERNQNLAEYQKMQLNEKRRKAKEHFYQLNEDSYKTKLMLEREDDEFIKYAEGWIREYQQQGKDITPMLLQLKKYKKETSFM